MSNLLFILNDPFYGTERSYNALRLVGFLAKREGQHVRVFLLGDAGETGRSRAEEILSERYGRSEIDRETYQRMLEDLRGGPPN